MWGYRTNDCRFTPKRTNAKLRLQTKRNQRTPNHRYYRQKFVRLTVLHRAGKDRHGKVLWRCLCDCGLEKTVLGGNLHGGKTRSCGCRGLSPIAPGMRFGRLTVINRAESSSSGDIRYTCLCDCGNIAQPRAYDLRRKDARGTRSCGCLHRERVTRHGDRAYGNISS